MPLFTCFKQNWTWDLEHAKWKRPQLTAATPQNRSSSSLIWQSGEAGAIASKPWHWLSYVQRYPQAALQVYKGLKLRPSYIWKCFCFSIRITFLPEFRCAGKSNRCSGGTYRKLFFELVHLWLLVGLFWFLQQFVWPRIAFHVIADHQPWMPVYITDVRAAYIAIVGCW